MKHKYGPARGPNATPRLEAPGMTRALCICLALAGSACSGGASADGKIPPIDGQWKRAGTDESLTLAGPGLYASSGSVHVTLNTSEHAGESVDGTFDGRSITFSLAGQHEIQLLNDSQLTLDGAMPPYQKTFELALDLPDGFWCESGAPGSSFTFEDVGSADVACSKNVVAESYAVTHVGGVADVATTARTCDSDPEDKVYTARVLELAITTNGNVTSWRGELKGVSRAELTASGPRLVLQHRATAAECK